MILIFHSFKSKMISSYQWRCLSVLDQTHWLNIKKKELSNKNWISWNNRCFECEKTLRLIKKFRSETEFSSNYLRNSKSSIKFVFEISYRLIKKTVDFKSNQYTIEIKLYNDVTMFNDHENAKNFEKLIKKYDSLWKKKNTRSKIFESTYMSVLLKLDWINHLKINRICSFEIENHALIDKTFDKLHQYKKIKWTKNFIFFEYFVFVIWKIVIKNEKSIRKKRVVIDIKKLNKIIINNVYFMSI